MISVSHRNPGTVLDMQAPIYQSVPLTWKIPDTSLHLPCTACRLALTICDQISSISGGNLTKLGVEGGYHNHQVREEGWPSVIYKEVLMHPVLWHKKKKKNILYVRIIDHIEKIVLVLFRSFFVFVGDYKSINEGNQWLHTSDTWLKDDKMKQECNQSEASALLSILISCGCEMGQVTCPHQNPSVLYWMC